MAQEWGKGGQFRKVEYRLHNGHYDMHINFTPTIKKLAKAQYALDAQVWQDVQKYMPHASGALISETNQLNAQACGTGRVYLYPLTSKYGHYQHEGIVYVDPVYHYASFPIYDANGVFLGLRSRFGVQKIPSNRKLKYSDPKAQAHWGEVAMKNHKKEWEKLVLKELR